MGAMTSDQCDPVSRRHLRDALASGGLQTTRPLFLIPSDGPLPSEVIGEIRRGPPTWTCKAEGSRSGDIVHDVGGR